MNIFKLGKFTLHSGRQSAFKIDLDDLKRDDWFALAHMGRRMVAPFMNVVSCGGAADNFAQELGRVVTVPGGTLIVDDVFTTGKTMEKKREQVLKNEPTDIPQGLVVFARGPRPSWVRAIFTLDRSLWNQ